MFYIVILVIVLIIGLIVAYTSEIQSQDCLSVTEDNSNSSPTCTHWVHDNRSRWRHDLQLSPLEVTNERIDLLYSVVEWRRSLIATIIITVPICFIMCYKRIDEMNAIRLFIITFIYVFIIIFFLGMYFQELWRCALST